MAAPLFMGGLFNFTDPLFGLQLYIWGWIFLIILAVVSWLGWRYGSWEAYKPVWGLFYAFKGESQAAFIFNAGLISELLAEKDAKCIFEYAKIKYTGVGRFKKYIFNYATVFLPDLPLAKAILYKYGGRNLDVEIAKKMQNHEWEKFSSVTLGGTHTDLILDADRWTVRESPQHKIIEAQCDVHNDGNPSDEIHAYSKYQRYLAEGKIPVPAGITPYITVPWSRIDSSFPVNQESNEVEGAIRQFAKEMEESENNSLSKYYWMILGGGLGFAALLLIVRMVMHYFG